MKIKKFKSDNNGVDTCTIDKFLLDNDTYIFLFIYLDKTMDFYKRKSKEQYEIYKHNLKFNLRQKSF